MTGAPGMGKAPATTGAAPRHIMASDLADFVARLFRAAGVPADAARAVASGLVDADLEGLHSHGVMLVDMYIERICQGSVSRNERAIIVSERHGAVVLDAGNALGQLTGRQAMAIAVDKAKEFGAGVVAVRHGCVTAFISELPANMPNRRQPPTASVSRCATHGL
jgi:LDH2 family malate/lactate/ureidoglycolate dehydrogenase